MDIEQRMKDIRIEMGVLKQKMHDSEYVNPEDERQFAILTGELSDLKKRQAHEDAPMFLREGAEKFVKFLDTLKTSENEGLIESVKRGYVLLHEDL